MKKIKDKTEYSLGRQTEKRKQGAESPLRKRLLIEEFLLATSTRFIHLSCDQVHNEIHYAMTKILPFLKADFLVLIRTHPSRTSWMITHYVSNAGVPAVPVSVEIPASVYPWAYEQLLLKNKHISFSRTEELPDQAAIDRETLSSWGIRSCLILPIIIGESSDHIMAIASLKQELVWPEKVISTMRLLGEIFVNALERSRIQKALQESEKREEELLHWSKTSLNTLINSTSNMICSVDPEHFGLLTFNRSFAEYILHQHGIHIKIGMRPEDICPDEEVVRKWHWFYKKTLDEGSFTTEYQLNADRKVLQLNFNIFKIDDRVSGISLFSQDITPLKEMENSFQEQSTEIRQLKSQLEEENLYIRHEIKKEHGACKLIGSSDTLQYVLFRVQQVAPTDATVLILGETGVGKGMVARAIHDMSVRKTKAMVTVNCAALPANLIESELFGREKGAFTGANDRQAGRFELADGGTIFLDEIGELPLELQAKLLRVLQDGEFERLGSPRTVKVDIRVIASTNRDLKEESRLGRFRMDLYYRLNTFPVTLPPLRMRMDDIPELTQHFIEKYSRKYGKHFDVLSRGTMKRLQAYNWPGNVRELEHIIERGVITSPEPVFQVIDQLDPEPGKGADNSLKGFEAIAREHIQQILQETRWKIDGKDGAAAILGLNPSTLRFRIRKLGIKRP